MSTPSGTRIQQVVGRRVEPRRLPVGGVGGEEDQAREEVAGEARRQGEGHGQGEGTPAAYVHEAGHGQRHERQRVVERGLRGVVDEGARQPELQQAVQQAGRRRRDHAAAHGDEDDGQQLEAHRAALRHHEDAHLPEHGRQGDGDPDLGESLHAPVGGVQVEPRARIEGGRWSRGQWSTHRRISPFAGITQQRPKTPPPRGWSGSTRRR